MKKRMKANKPRMGNEKGIALVWAYLMSVFLLTVLTGFYSYSMWDVKNMSIELLKPQAFFLAEAAIDKKLSEIRSGNTAALNTTTLTGVGTYQAGYDPATKIVTGTGTAGGVTSTVSVKLSNSSDGGVPGVQGALNVNANANINDYLVIDGRNHDVSGNYINDNNGLAGISFYGSTVLNLFSVKVGGYTIAPTLSPINPLSVLYRSDNSTNNSLAAVFGFNDESALEPYKHSTPPGNPLNNEVYYYNLTDKNQTISISLNNGSGILIVHDSDSSTTARFTGNFKGLIICDHCTFLSSTIIGAVVALNPNSALNGLPNGSYSGKSPAFSQILYSKDVIDSLPTFGVISSLVNMRVQSWTTGNATRLTPADQAEPVMS